MRVAALDLGSNTFLCLIADLDSQGQLKIVEDLAEVVRLGEGVGQTGVLSPAALQRAKSCLERFSGRIQSHQPQKILAVATAASRKAKNGQELLDLCASVGIPVQIISGDAEAMLTFQGALSGTHSSSDSWVVDIGGGSTELIWGSTHGIQFKKSFEIGVVKLREKFIHHFPISQEELEQMRDEIKETLSFQLPPLKLTPAPVVSVAGTPTTLAAAALGGFDADRVDGFRFTLRDLKNWENKLSQMTPESIESVYGVQKGRSDVLVCGVMILIAALELVRKEELVVSVRGLRYGLAQRLAAGDETHVI